MDAKAIKIALHKNALGSSNVVLPDLKKAAAFKSEKVPRDNLCVVSSQKPRQGI